jgi:hypothetical protein
MTWQFLTEGAESYSILDVHRAPLPIPKLPVTVTPSPSATLTSAISDAAKASSNAEGTKMSLFQRGLSSLRTKHPKLSSHFQLKKDDGAKTVLTPEELAAQCEAAAAALPDSDRLKGWEGFVSSILAATVFSSANEVVYLDKINVALKDAIKDKKFITTAEFTDLKIRDRLVLQSTGVLEPLVPAVSAPTPGFVASSSADGSSGVAASESDSCSNVASVSAFTPSQCFGWFVKLPRHAISGQLQVTGKKVLSFSIKLAFSMELVGSLRSDIDFLPSPMLRVSFTSMPCFQVFLESTIKVGSLPLPIDKKLKKIIETKLREGIEKTMLLPHQLRVPLKPMGPAPSSVATQWDESDLVGKLDAALIIEPISSAISSAGASGQSIDSPISVPHLEESDGSDSDNE